MTFLRGFEMNVAKFIHQVLLRPKPLRAIENACLRAIIPERIERYGATVDWFHANPLL